MGITEKVKGFVIAFSGLAPFSVRATFFVGQFFVEPLPQPVRKMDIPRTGSFTFKVVTELIFQQVCLQQINRNLTTRIRPAIASACVIRVRFGNDFLASGAVTFYQVNPFTQPVTTTLAPEFIGVIRYG